MPGILVIGGLIVLFLAIRGGATGSVAASASFSRTGGGGSLPDPAAMPATMSGSAAMSVPPVTAITPFSGTAKLSPDQALARLNGANRIAAFGIGTPRTAIRIPRGPTVRTSNPAQTPFSAVATNPINGLQAFGPTKVSVTTVLGATGGRKL